MRLAWLLAFTSLVTACGSDPASNCGNPAPASPSTPAAPESGASWSVVGLQKDIVSSLALDPKNPASIVVGLSAGGAHHGAYRTLDRGKTWAKVEGGLPDRLATYVALCPAAGALLANPGVDGLWRSIDGGETWTASASAATDPGGTNGIYCHPKKAQVFTVTSQAGVFRSDDGGASYARTANKNLPLNQFVLGPVHHDGTRLYLGSASNGVWTSDDEGETWSQAPSENLPMTGPQGEITAITSDGAGKLYVKTMNALYVSRDAAKSFQKIAFGEPGARYGGLYADAKQVLASMDEASGGTGGLARSTDSANSWSRIGPMTLPVIVTGVASDGAIYVGTVGEGLWVLR